jgi:hypothetical protein
VTFQAAHGARGGAFSPLRLLGAIGAQAAYVSPVVLVLAALAAARALKAPRDPVLAALAFSALPVVVFFTAAAAFTPGALPHWPAPGWLSATMLLAVAGTRHLRPALAVGFAAIAAVLVLVLAPLPLPGGPLDELRGWREGATAARAAAGDARLAVTHWIALGQLGWYDGASPAYLGDRRSGPSFYDPDPLAAGKPLLVVTVDGLGPGPAAVAARLGPIRPAGEAVATERGRVIRRYRFWWWEPPAR